MTVRNELPFFCSLILINPLNPAGRKTGLTEKPHRPKRPVNWPSGLPSLSCKPV